MRVATLEDEARWLELARGATAAQLEKVVRGVGKARGDGVPSEKPRSRVQWDEDGTLVLTLRIGAAHATGVLAALEGAQQQEQRDRDQRLAALGAELAVQLPVGVSAETPGEPEEPAPPYAEP